MCKNYCLLFQEAVWFITWVWCEENVDKKHNYWESKAVLAYSAHQLDENYMTKLWPTVTDSSDRPHQLDENYMIKLWPTVTDSSDRLIWLMWGRHNRTVTYWGSTRRGTWERSSSVSADETALLCQLSGSWEPVNKKKHLKLSQFHHEKVISLHTKVGGALLHCSHLRSIETKGHIY